MTDPMGFLAKGPICLAEVQRSLHEADLDGWLFYDFHGQNPIAKEMLGLQKTTRRSFTLIPAQGEPTALIQAIEHGAWDHWPWKILDYQGWAEMEEKLTSLLQEKPRLAMEISPNSNVPTLDRVPSGILQLLVRIGADVVSSGDFVSIFHSVWTEEQLKGHRRCAEIARKVAREAFEKAAKQVRHSKPLLEGELGDWIRNRLYDEGLENQPDCHVAIGKNAADPHYDPGQKGDYISEGEILLIDLWGKEGAEGVFADQTWMGILDRQVSPRVQKIWTAVRNAREEAIKFLNDSHVAREKICGYQVDDVCRQAIAMSGFGDFFVHRTGHSMDVDLHGSGPNLDNLETRDDRTLISGVGFSVEPGVYIPNEVGIRSEINVYWGPEGPEVTPKNRQSEILTLLE
tara:strand:+ start:15076 stop:16278 length:1203 start_codon:yes stop_codon:yes gene_type:complete